jgi:predicted RNA-binding Zn ribbon-like protein
MASVVVDGLVLPVSLAGHPALDFCNTRAGWGSPAPKEYLTGHPHLTVWAGANGLLPAPAVAGLRRAAAAAPAAAAAVLDRALRLRSALYAILTGTGGPADWTAVNEEVRRAGSVAVLAPGVPEGSAASWTVPAGGLDSPLLAVAWAAAGLLASRPADVVGACPGAGCGWLFADSRHRRRWCSMALCGNRSKVRRHAERAASAKPG